MAPAACRPTSASAPSEICIPSDWAISRSRATIFPNGTSWKLCRCTRERMVAGSFCGSAVARRQIFLGFPERAHVVHAVVGGGVDLLHVHVVALGDLDARAAHAARLGRGTFLAVQRSRQDARAGGLPAYARPGEEKRVRHPPRLERVDQGADHVLLAGELRKTLRPVLSGEN